MQDQPSTPNLKSCSRCGVSKSLEEFPACALHKSKDGRAQPCRACKRDLWKRKHPRKPKPEIPDGMKRCGHCRELKPLDGFWGDAARKDGKQTACKVCAGAMCRRYFDNNKAAIKQRYQNKYPPGSQCNTPPDQKQCSKCGQLKPLTSFYVNIRYDKGVTGQCKDCRKAYTLERDQRVARMPKPVLATKFCKSCEIEKPVEAFNRSRVRPDGLACRCKDCRRHHERITADTDELYRRGRETRLWTAFRLRLEDFDAMLRAQDEKCAICDKPMKRVHVDHDHATGKVRALLCAGCNTALGYIERPGFLESAQAYLARYLS